MFVDHLFIFDIMFAVRITIDEKHLLFLLMTAKTLREKISGRQEGRVQFCFPLLPSSFLFTPHRNILSTEGFLGK